jgi:hypothetical protein
MNSLSLRNAKAGDPTTARLAPKTRTNGKLYIISQRRRNAFVMRSSARTHRYAELALTRMCRL